MSTPEPDSVIKKNSLLLFFLVNATYFLFKNNIFIIFFFSWGLAKCPLKDKTSRLRYKNMPSTTNIYWR